MNLEQIASRRINHDRAAALSTPVWRSAAPGLLTIGYSVFSVDGIDTGIETTQLLPVKGTQPLRVTVRTFVTWSDPDVEWRFHAADYLSVDSVDGDDANARALDRFTSLNVGLVQIPVGRENAAVEVAVNDDTSFTRYRAENGRVLGTAALPRFLMSAGFVDGS